MADTEPLHIPLNARLALFLRFFSFNLAQIEADFLQSTSIQLPAEDTLRARKCFGALREGIDHTVANLFDDFAWRQPIDTSLAQISAQLKDELQTLSGLIATPRSGQVVSDITQTLCAIDCNACRVAAGLDHVCRGDQRTDSELVARQGLCFRWILDIAEYASTYAHDVYGPILARFRLTAPALKFCTGLRLGARSHGLNHPAQLSAKTQLSDAPLGASAITLFVSNKFDLPSWLAVLYALFHEYICHAFQALDRDRILSRDRSADSRFSEGWMDAVAHRLARLEIETPSKAFPLALIPYRLQQLTEIQSLFEARYATDAPENPRKRLTGVRAYERVAICFWYNTERGAAGTSDSIQFSLALNVAAREDELEQITTLLLKLLPHRPDVPGYHSRSRVAWLAMRRFIHDGDVRQLIVDLTRLADELSAI